MLNVRIADDSESVMRCFPVLRELRPKLDEGDFARRAAELREQHGYTLVYIDEGGSVPAAAGFRIVESLDWGKALYIDDFVTAKEFRRQGHGDRLLEWLIAEARRQQCAQIHLDSAVQRHPAHRLYMSRGLAITCHHFCLKLQD